MLFDVPARYWKRLAGVWRKAPPFVATQLLILALGCGGVTPVEPETTVDRLGVWAPDAGATILRTASSRLEDPTSAVVSDLISWRALWAEAWGGPLAAPTLPAIDFVLSSVVVVALGKRAGLGYAVTIDSIVVHTVGAVLFATESLPGAHCDASPGSSTAVHMVHAPGHPPVIEWRVNSIRRDCGP